MPATIALVDGVLDKMTTVEVCDHAATAVYFVRNPAKLSTDTRG